MPTTKIYRVFKIANGTVIDHVPGGQAVRLITLLRLLNSDSIVTMGANMPSKKLGRKDIIKIENRELTPDEINQVYLIAPEASINIIRNGEISKKFPVEIPGLLTTVAHCPNPKCITNHEIIKTKFTPKRAGKKIFFQCHYCEKEFDQRDLV
ncbi:MAG: aspartate carbamoyltransferase regulatory subunit [Candidatus Magasanikbacteria bacterium RIFCSPHIGHO2_01_FULL_41_23]|uniref:Aspartate carbamoyltransferase regulatory chain n=1 Tax=Candidatus Magasanikbacteria bacterium RIFCSPLOWO2_01_FULL_40_15 TaxID=1798686 RepID=A0A1F6N566_9BACT|nr:MAG: aspartate carbamoyltransferase regulatory subunit [Candidatus Magasanikbacteria bacterium RIFCSPHIGHO2_01_FULL_41_23]OGH66731.1 MAG: aspartate carbamoyltransferase regulatory subunit [Candidatus Magasanikbacteria bacterium RIFCSPHIGHO2_02_FULL_41_35]OGH74531.1 MAG: aspartate carbamoyltransferase regulatory subunit [Candidatus Magasanikbacteria bacterium RIFCSPHIGHO2_12_FULL_41_16]OGH78820.1 MAG: aspartate carbamoyltransferase regulatory subunit [Candidatus Magasanikbacteria bacterium RIF